VAEVSVIVVTWNGRQHLETCLAAVADQRDVDVETILVDNGSTDGTSAFVRERFPWVKVVLLDANRGFAGGNNAGAREATGRYLAFLNNDTQADPGWLRALRDGIDQSNGIALATSRIVYMHDPAVVDSAGDGMTRAGGAFKRFHGGPATAAAASCEVFGACGAACMMPRTVFEELGGFDEDFFASHEDVDVSYRARLLGYRCRYVAGAIVRHRGSATLGRVSALAIFQGQRNLEWVYVKNTPASILARTLLSHMIYNMAAAVHFARLGLLGTFLRAKLAALGGLPLMLRKRAVVQRSRAVRTSAIWQVLEPGWVRLKLKEKRFDMSIRQADGR
jgi:GT2 family glycosyltransferase